MDKQIEKLAKELWSIGIKYQKGIGKGTPEVWDRKQQSFVETLWETEDERLKDFVRHEAKYVHRMVLEGKIEQIEKLIVNWRITYSGYPIYLDEWIAALKKEMEQDEKLV